MHGATFPRVPGLGLAPAMSTSNINLREQEALRRDAWDRENAAYAKECPPARSAERITEKVTTPVRATAI